MDPPLINESSFSSPNPSSEFWPYSSAAGIGVLGLRMGNFAHNLSGFLEAAAGIRDGDVSVDESTVTEQSGGGGGGGRKRRECNSEDESSKLVSTSTAYHLNDSCGKRMKISESHNENGDSKGEADANSGPDEKPSEQSIRPPEPPKLDYIHVRARRGQATDSHSLAERARREKISERMKVLQDLVPGCNKIIGKALVLDEIINYIQSLQCQIEFMSMKLEAVTARVNPTVQGFPSKDLGQQAFDAGGGIAHGSSSQATRN